MPTQDIINENNNVAEEMEVLFIPNDHNLINTNDSIKNRNAHTFIYGFLSGIIVSVTIWMCNSMLEKYLQ